jgi:hypothetical protein
MQPRDDGPPNPNGLNKDGLLAQAEKEKNRPTLFNAHERAAYVKKCVDEVLFLKRTGKTQEEIKQLTGSFHEMYPTLFLKMFEANFDFNNFQTMMGLLNRMGDKSLTQHQASVIVGQRMVDKYIKPVAKNVPKDNYE